MAHIFLETLTLGVEVLDLRFLELAFLRPKVEFMLPEAPEDFGDNSAVRLEVRMSDKDVVQIDHDVPGENEVLENIIHHGLERRRGVGEPEIHHQRLEQPPVGLECCLPLIALPDPDVVEPPSDVELCKKPGSL